MPILLDDETQSLIDGLSNKKRNPEIVLDDETQRSIDSLPTRKTAPNPLDRLDIGQKILTNPNVGKIIDFLNGGASLRQVEDVQTAQASNLDKMISPYKQAPAILADASKTLINSGVIPMQGTSFLPQGGIFQPPVAPTLPPPNAMESLDAVGKIASVAAIPFMPAAGGILGAANALIHNKPVLKTSLEGVIDPSTAPMMSSPENVPLTKWEREGGTERLIPRAIMQGVENVALGMLMGAPSALKRGYEGAKINGVEKDFNADFSKIDPLDVQDILQEQGLFSDKMTPEQKADLTHIALNQLKNKLKNDPRVGDYYAKQQTPLKLLKDAKIPAGLSIEDVSGKTPEKRTSNVPTDAPQDNIVRDQSGAPISFNMPVVKPQVVPQGDNDEHPILAFDSKNGVMEPSASPERWAQVVSESKKAKETKIKDIIEKAGGKFVSITDQKNSLYENEPTIYYDTPSGSTQTIRPSQLNVENVKSKIEGGDSNGQSQGQSGQKENVLTSQGQEAVTQNAPFPMELQPPMDEKIISLHQHLDNQIESAINEGIKPSEAFTGYHEDTPGGQLLRHLREKGKSDAEIEAIAKSYIDEYNKYIERDKQEYPDDEENARAKIAGNEAAFTKQNISGTDAIGNEKQTAAKEISSASIPPAEPPKTTFDAPMFSEDSGTPQEPDNSSIIRPPEELAQLEMEMLDYTGGIHPLEKAMQEVGKVKPYKNGKELEEYREIPKRFRGNGVALDEARDMLNEMGFDFQSDIDLRMALKELGDKTKRHVLSQETQSFLKNKENVEKLGKLMEGTLPPSRYKRLVYSSTGIKKIETPLNTTVEKMLKNILRSQAKGSKLGFRAGKAKIRADIRMKKLKAAEEREIAQRFTPAQRRELHVAALKKGLIYDTQSGKTINRKDTILNTYKDATFEQVKEYINTLAGDKDNPPLKAVVKLYGDIKADGEVIKLINEYSKNWRDINKMEVASLDPVRISEKVTGNDSWDERNLLAANTTDVLAGADSARFDEQDKMISELHKVAKGILADTKISGEIMRKAENGEKLTAHEQEIVAHVRSESGKLRERANVIRAKYGMKPLGYIKDYITHIREYNALIKLFKGDVREISNLTNQQLDAIRKSDFTKPNIKSNPHAKTRTGPRTKYDIIGNFEKYVDTMLNEIHMLPAIAHSRKFVDYSLLKFPNAYRAYSLLLNELAGKPSIYDTAPGWNVVINNPMLTKLRRLIAKNALVGNINFNLMNASNIATSSGELGNYVIKGMGKFLSDPEMRAAAFKHSDLLKSRKGQFDADINAISVFNPASLDKLTAVDAAKVASKQIEFLLAGLTRVIEYNNVGSTVVGAYMKAIQVYKFSPEKAWKYADAVARRTQVGYKNYEMPSVMRSNTGKTLLMFQTWTFNAMNHLIYDMKFGNIPNQLIENMSKAGKILTMQKPAEASGGSPSFEKPTDVRYRAGIVLIGTLMATAYLYKKMKWREPYGLSSISPRIPSKLTDTPVGRLGQDIVTAATGELNKRGVDNLLSFDIPRHEDKTISKSENRILGTMSPFGGGQQIARFLSGEILPSHDWEDKNDKKQIVHLYEKAIKEDDVEKRRAIVARADKMAYEQNMLIKDLRKQAASNVHRQETGFASSIEEKLHKKQDDAFIDELKKMIANGSLTKDGAKKVIELRLKRFKEQARWTNEMQKQSAEYPSSERNRINPNFFSDVNNVLSGK